MYYGIFYNYNTYRAYLYYDRFTPKDVEVPRKKEAPSLGCFINLWYILYNSHVRKYILSNKRIINQMDKQDFNKIFVDITEELHNIQRIDMMDLSDIGNSIGMAIARNFEDKMGYEKEDFIAGIRHGISLIDGTHGGKPILDKIQETKISNIVDVKLVCTYKDGGTRKYYGVKDKQDYYQDNRIFSETRGLVYDRYPGDEDAAILPVVLNILNQDNEKNIR